MIVKIDIKDRDIIAAMCAQFDYRVRFYTMENAPLMTKAEIKFPNGNDLTPELGFSLGRVMEMDKGIQELKSLRP